MFCGISAFLLLIRTKLHNALHRSVWTRCICLNFSGAHASITIGNYSGDVCANLTGSPADDLSTAAGAAAAAPAALRRALLFGKIYSNHPVEQRNVYEQSIRTQIRVL